MKRLLSGNGAAAIAAVMLTSSAVMVLGEGSGSGIPNCSAWDPINEVRVTWYCGGATCCYFLTNIFNTYYEWGCCSENWLGWDTFTMVGHSGQSGLWVYPECPCYE